MMPKKRRQMQDLWFDGAEPGGTKLDQSGSPGGGRSAGLLLSLTGGSDLLRRFTIPTMVLLLALPVFARRNWTTENRGPDSLPSGTVPQSTTKAAQPPHAKKKKRGAALPAQTVAQPAPPARAPWPAELPPNPARVTFADGELTIVANNSTLGDVLASVRRAARITIDAPPAAASERVYAKIGPGTPNAVLTSLLAGSNFDYVILGSTERPGAVQRVILTAKSSVAPPGGTQPVPVTQPAQPGEQSADEEAAEPEPEQTEPEPQPEGQQTPPEAGQQQRPGDNNPDRPKTPEELLEELRQLQQKQQQEQQQQNPLEQQ